MSKASVLTFIQEYCTGQADPITIDLYYDDVVRDLGLENWLVETSLVTATAGTSEYSPPANTVRLVAVFYDDRSLYRTMHRELEAAASGWRDHIGTPVAYLIVDQTLKNFKIYPKPDVDTKPLVFIFGSPLGLDYPEYSVAAVHTETRVDLPEWLDIPVTFEIMAREFARESDHKDQKFAEACKKLAEAFFGMVG